LNKHQAMEKVLVGMLGLLTWCSVAGAIQDTPAPAGAIREAQAARPTFRSAVDLVTLNATVRTRRGRPVTNLKPEDFELLDSGTPRKIAQFRTEASPVSVALLVDFSGSMGVGARRTAARDTAADVVNALTPGTDRAGLYVFDKTLRELQPIAPAPGDILAELAAVERPFGATSLFDAIAETGRSIAAVGGARRAVVALTDGADNASRLTAADVSGLASSIDVPVYIIVVVSPLDRSGHTTVDDARLMDAVVQGPLGNLARWTGGEIYVGVGPVQSKQSAQSIVDELRQQYLIAFEPGQRLGWHPLELRTRDKDLVVRARSGYIVQSPRTGL
jgi:VWFA-related protein